MAVKIESYTHMIKSKKVIKKELGSIIYELVHEDELWIVYKRDKIIESSRTERIPVIAEFDNENEAVNFFNNLNS